MDLKIVKNYLDNENYYILNKEINSDYFPLYYTNNVSYRNKKDSFMFNHIFYNNGVNSSFFEKIVLPLIKPLNVKNLIRAKLNFYTNQKHQIKHVYHTDSEEDHKVALYSLNTNNGYTEFENGPIVKSVANQLCVFDGKLKHRSVTQTDKDSRINININFI